jgi:hypothetical protein
VLDLGYLPVIEQIWTLFGPHKLLGLCMVQSGLADLRQRSKIQLQSLPSRQYELSLQRLAGRRNNGLPAERS